VCHVVTALGLRPVAVSARVLLATGGMATVVLAAFPQPVTGSSRAHVAAAAVAFPALSLWPALAWRRGANPGLAVGPAAALGLLVLLGWFGFEYFADGPRIGLSERLLAGAQALCPLTTTLLARPTSCVLGPDRGYPSPL